MTEKTPRPSEEAIPNFSTETLIEIGQLWGGRHWQSDMARETGFSKSHLARLTKKSRNITKDFGEQVDRILVDKIDDVTDFINHRGSPNNGNPGFIEGKKLLEQALTQLRKVCPAVPRVTIEETTFRKRKPGRDPKKSKKKIKKKSV